MSRLSLDITQDAWDKLKAFASFGSTEVGGFGITTVGKPLVVHDFQTVKQTCSVASVIFDDDSLNDWQVDMVEAGLHPCEFYRVWIHTHPGMEPNPSAKDEETFERIFGGCNYAVMFILGHKDKTYCKLSINIDDRLKFTVLLDVNVIPALMEDDRKKELKEIYDAHVDKEYGVVAGKGYVGPHFNDYYNSGHGGGNGSKDQLGKASGGSASESEIASGNTSTAVSVDRRQIILDLLDQCDPSTAYEFRTGEMDEEEAEGWLDQWCGINVEEEIQLELDCIADEIEIADEEKRVKAKKLVKD